MCRYNVHVYKPRSLCQWCLLCVSYLPPVMAVLLIAANILLYHLYMLPRLYAACVLGNASWLNYYYGFAMMVFAESMVYGNFALAIFTAPGYVPHAIWAQPPKYAGKAYSENPFEVRQLDRNGKLRYCPACDQFKPDNAHHCHMCNRCVFRMDHHCPWINNCVGRENAKYFLLFIAYIPLGAFHIVFHTAYCCLNNFQHLKLGSDDGSLTLVVLYGSILFSMLMGFCFSCFAGHFCYMTYSGETSVSQMVARKSGKPEATRLSTREEHLYDVFGADRRWWRLAFCFRPKRDGRDGLPDDINTAYRKQHEQAYLQVEDDPV